MHQSKGNYSELTIFPIMINALRKAIMKRPECQSKYIKNRTSGNLKSYKKTKKFLQ